VNVQLTAERSLALLRENASHLVSLTRDQPARSLARSPQPDEWSPNDVLAHIRACCDVWGGNIEKILAEEHATFQGVNAANLATAHRLSGVAVREGSTRVLGAAAGAAAHPERSGAPGLGAYRGRHLVRAAVL